MGGIQCRLYLKQYFTIYKYKVNIIGLSIMMVTCQLIIIGLH